LKVEGCEIQRALGALIGLPLWGTHRAADLQCFAFGDRHPTVTRRGEPAERSDYSLHVQCSWRLVGPDGIIAGRRDLYYPAGDDPYEGLDDFDYDGPVMNRRSARLADFFEARESEPLVVVGCSADDLGGFRLDFDGGFRLEVFPDDSLDSERWRLLTFDRSVPHFVVTGAGIE
jgi:hypothetical protein